MDAPSTTSIAQAVADYWKEFLVGVGVVGSIWTYVKHVHGKWGSFKEWCRDFAAAPSAVKEIKSELQLDTGITLRQAVKNLGTDVSKVAALLAAETKWRRSIVDAMDTPIFEADKDGLFRWSNVALLEITDLEMTDILGHNWRKFIATADRQQVVDGWLSAVRDCSDFRTKFTLITKDGEVPYILNSLCNKDEYGNTLNFVGKLRPLGNQPHRTEG